MQQKSLTLFREHIKQIHQMADRSDFYVDLFI